MRRDFSTNFKKIIDMLRCKINISAKSHNKKNLMIFIEHCTIKIFFTKWQHTCVCTQQKPIELEAWQAPG